MSNTLQSSHARSDNHQCPLASTEIFTLCKEFALVTNTNTDIAMIMLQENEWNLEQAVNVYLDKPKSTFEKNDDQHPALSVSCFFPEYPVE
jgi:hypothetical protein